MTRILVTGGTGQVARALGASAAAQGLTLTVVGRPDFDFDQPQTLPDTLAAHRPDIIVNAAAYTAVDKAECDQDAAWRANHAGPAALACLCATAGIRLLHLSTDYVFSGAQPAPYREDDPTGPTGVYGASKLGGERAVLAALPDAIILRTAWVYAATGKNFLLTMLNAARKTATLRVVADQHGCPTAADDLAHAILHIIAQPWQPGLYHATGSGHTTWHGFAAAVFDQASRHGLAAPAVVPVATVDWPTPAQRPANSRLDCGRLHRVFGLALPPWQTSVARTVDAVFSAPSRDAAGK